MGADYESTQCRTCTYDYLVNVLENLCETDALLLGDVLLVRDVVAVIVRAIRSNSSTDAQALLTPRLLRKYSTTRSRAFRIF